MAHTIDAQTLLDGSRELIVKITITGDGASGELSAQKIVDASTYSPAYTEAAIMSIDASLDEFGAKLAWDATTDDEAFAIGEGSNNFDFRPIGGLINPASTGNTGDIMLTTLGLASSAKTGSILLRIRKRELGS